MKFCIIYKKEYNINNMQKKVIAIKGDVITVSKTFRLTY